MIEVHTELISGIVFGMEYVEGYEIEDTDTEYISIDLFFFRLVIEITK